jgi:hypothetical protein
MRLDKKQSQNVKYGPILYAHMHSDDVFASTDLVTVSVAAKKLQTFHQ